MQSPISVKKQGVPESFVEPFPLMSKQEWKQFQNPIYGDLMNELDHDYHAREKYVRNNAWFILTSDNADYLAEYLKDKNVLEVGAGTGYVAAHLRKRGVENYRAVDMWSSWYWTHDVANYGSECGDALGLDYEPYDVVIMGWPPMGDPFARKVLQKMRVGQVMIYQGESFGGCTGTDSMFHYLDLAFERDGKMTMDLERHHIRFSGMRDNWGVYKKVADK